MQAEQSAAAASQLCNDSCQQHAIVEIQKVPESPESGISA